MKVIESVGCMQDICLRLASERKSIRLVPTMGALHDGHGSLIERAKEDEELHDVGRSICVTNGDGGDGGQPGLETGIVVIVSIFVNPIQFSDSQDLAKYPRTIDSDLAMCRRLDVDFVFMPKSEEIYGNSGRMCESPGQNMCTVKPPDRLAGELEGRSRPGHFEGMLTIVSKLFNTTRPQRAYFGEKDYQQLVLVRHMSEDFNMRVQIVPVKTVREPATNLPLSSRNSRLSLKQRHLAAQMMSETLMSTARLLEDKCCLGSPELDLDAILVASLASCQIMIDIEQSLSMTDSDEEDAPTISTDYFELRCAKDLTVTHYDKERNRYDCQLGCSCDRMGEPFRARLLMSVLVSKVRLLDNVNVQLNLPPRGCR